jgi:hypothetical protein
MSRTRYASTAFAMSAVLVMASGGTALASHGGGGGSGGGGGTPTPPPSPTGAPAVAIAPQSVSFGSQAVGTASTPQTVTVTNTGTAPLFFNAESQGGNNSLDFTDTNSQCVGISVPPGGSCALTLGFKPTATGTRTGTLQLFDNAPTSPQIINLSGTGTSTTGPTPLTVDTTGLTCTSGTCALADSIVNNFYFTSLSASGDTQPPFTWTLAGGTLPAGLSLASNGQISGSSTATGTSTFSAKVTDPTGKTATQAFSITITPPPPLGPSGCPKIGGQPNSVSASMSGPAIAGRVPGGQAVLDESRVTTCGGFSVLNVTVNNVNLPDNTTLWIYFDSRLVGRVALVNGAAKMPAFNLGDYLSRKDSVSVYDTPPPVTTLEPATLSSGFLQ